MYTGHFAVALIGAARARRLPMGLAIAAAFSGDLTEAVVAAGNVNDVTRVWSHSVPATAAFGVVLALAWRAFGGTWRECAVLIAMAMSHSALDFVTAPKTYMPGFAPQGFGLYRHSFADYLLECALAIAGWLVWRSHVPARHRDSDADRGMLLLLLVAQAGAFIAATVWGAAMDSGGMSKFVR